MDQSLTVVLPMHNCERQLRSSVLDILELAASISRPLAVVVVDDGSTDDTYETAFELARSYPQVTVLRQSVRQGFGAALDLVRNRLAVERVVVHDGISVINASQLQALLQSECADQGLVERAVPATISTMDSCGSRRFSSVRELHKQMEYAHRTATCFRWMQLERPLVPRRSWAACTPLAQERALYEPAQTSGGPVHLVSLPMGMNPVPQA